MNQIFVRWHQRSIRGFIIFSWIFLVFTGIIVFPTGCANQQYPTGGPVDRDAPSIEYSSIQSGTTGFTSDRISLRFSEYMDKSSVTNSVFISPSVSGRYKLEWSGKSLDIRFTTSLKDSVTYVLTIGTGAKDYRAGNPLQQSWQLAFSTGSVIDSSRIHGQVFDAGDEKPVAGALVLSYLLSGEKEPDPSETPADYITQTGSDGRFELSYLRQANYRLFVIRDEFRNDVWDPSNEALGIGRSSTIPSMPQPDTVYTFYLQKVDKDPPIIQGVVADGTRLIRSTFSENVRWPDDSARFFLASETDNQFRPIYAWPATGRFDQFLLPLDTLTEGNYRLVQHGFTDDNLNRSTGDTFLFSLVSIPVSEKALLVNDPVDSTRILPMNIPATATFRQPVTIDSIRFWGKPVRSQRIRERLLDVEVKTENSYQFRFLPEKGWPQSHTIRGTVYTENDTVQFRFLSQDPEEEGSIQAVIPFGGKGRLRIIDVATRKVIREEQVETESVTVSGLPAGRYLIGGFEDRNGNSRWDPGTAIPWEGAEYRWFYPDTLRVRARWAIEDVRLMVR